MADVTNAFVSPDDIRARFARAMSDMYRAEVPQYGALLELVAEVNARCLAQEPDLQSRLRVEGALARLDIERHGAIRLGRADELATCARLFAVMGMEPVGYYDLSVAGVPVHSTAFRPVTDDALNRNPFRIFTSLLRIELIADAELRAEAEDILARRNIFTCGALELIEQYERNAGLPEKDAARFVSEALETFRWHGDATVSRETYDRLAQAHRLVADVVCFRGPHINHLTPRTLDIDVAQKFMPLRGIAAKAVVEGPPARHVPLLLRQTSFTALEEPVLFCGREGGDGDGREGTHTARFGEIEQRGVALTPQGRALYDALLTRVRSGTDGTYEERLEREFKAFPDDADTLRTQALAFFRYVLVDPDKIGLNTTLNDLVRSGAVAAYPLTYEDFLPVSAAGIFQSNLGVPGAVAFNAGAAQGAFEAALGRAVIDEMALYAAIEQDSLLALKAALAPFIIHVDHH